MFVWVFEFVPIFTVSLVVPLVPMLKVEPNVLIVDVVNVVIVSDPDAV